MADPLSPADRSSLAAERGPVNMACSGLILLDRGPGVSYEALCRRIEERIHLIPRYRQRLEQDPLGVAPPVWVDDEHFDVRWHVRQVGLPAPGGDAELADVMAREASRLMDRSRPLWELHLVEGLAGDRMAVIPKMHHALVDGLAAVGVGLVLLDPGPEPPPAAPAPAPWRPERRLPGGALARIATAHITRATRLGLEAADRLLDLSPREAVADLRRASELARTLARGRPPAPRLPFNRPISANRRYAFTSTPLAALKAAGKAAGGTVNDAILAAVAGMLARYLKEAGIEPASLPRDPVALVPISVRREGDPELGNRISVVLVDLPAGEGDAARRIALVHERMTAIKGSAQVAAGALMVEATGFAPPLLATIMALADTGGGGAFNLVVSNVPGPRVPVWLNGSRVRAVHPGVPLNPADQGLNVGVFSYDGTVCFGLTSDFDLDPPLERVVVALEAALAEAAPGGAA